MTKICPKCGNDFPEQDPYCARPDCVTYSTKHIVFPEEGGILTYISGHKYPLRCLPRASTVDANAAFKRNVPALMRLAFSFKPILLLLAFYPPTYILRKLAEWIEYIYVADFAKKKIPDKQFCQSGRELLRALRKFFGETKWVEAGVMVWEHDTAYRFRGQDGFALIDKTALVKNPRKEITRVLRIMFSRERSAGVQEKTQMLIFFLNIFLFIHPIIAKKIAEILCELSTEEMAMNINDRYYVAREFVYNYEGKSYEERAAWRAEEDKDWVEEADENQQGTQMQLVNLFVKPEYFAKNRQEAETIAEYAKGALLTKYEEMQNGK